MAMLLPIFRNGNLDEIFFLRRVRVGVQYHNRNGNTITRFSSLDSTTSLQYFPSRIVSKPDNLATKQHNLSRLEIFVE